MLNKILTATGIIFVTAACIYSQAAAPQRGARGAGGANAARLPTPEQWAANAKTSKYVAKAVEFAGDDPDLKFDLEIFCKASGGSGNEDRATIGVPSSEPRLEPYPTPNPKVSLGGQRLFDNFYWIGDTGVGAWLITSNDGYILFDALNNEQEARDVLVPAIKKLGLDPAKIKYMVFGHYHGDHTGGGEYMQRLYHPRVVMGRDDWDIYFKPGSGFGGTAQGNPLMKRDIDAEDGMTIQVGDVKATIYQMTGHTPGSIGMIVPVKYQGKQHPILLVTAATDAHNRESFVGGYEHIWDAGIKAKVESVMQDHPNTNMNLLARTTYVNNHYPPTKNPLFYGAERTARYINIMRNCTLARLEALGW